MSLLVAVAPWERVDEPAACCPTLPSTRAGEGGTEVTRFLPYPYLLCVCSL